MYLYVYFADGRIERHKVKRFSDLSQTRSQSYYYEEPGDEWGKGKSFRRDEIRGFDVSPYPLQSWDKHMTDEGDGALD